MSDRAKILIAVGLGIGGLFVVVACAVIDKMLYQGGTR